MNQTRTYEQLNQKRVINLILFIYILILCQLPCVAVGKTDSLVIATFQSPFPPMVWYEKNKTGQMEALGAEPDILRELTKRAGIEYKLIIMPWPRIKMNLESGEIDASLGGWKLPERETYGIYMDKPMLYDFFELYVVRGKEFLFEKVEDLFEKKIGKIRGVNVYPAMDQAIKDGKMKVIEADTRVSLIKMLRLGRLDGIITSTVVTGFDLKKLGVTDVVALPKPLTEPKGTYIWFSKKADIDPGVIARLNRAMESMHEDGSIKQILSKYGIRQDF